MDISKLNLANIIDLMSRVARSAGPIHHLIEAGTPVLDAIHEQAPELGAAIREIVVANMPPEHSAPKPAAAPGSAAAPVRLSHDQAATAVAKAIFTPYCVDQHEQAWMDRASSAQFG